MRADDAPRNDRCNVSKDKVFQPWLKKKGIEDVEAFVPDMAGSARGKVLPADKFGVGEMKMPEAIFSQTISGDYIKDPNNVEDRDMLLVSDPSTLRTVPWATDPTASVFLDCTGAIRRGSLRLRAAYCAVFWRSSRPKAGYLSWHPRSNSTC